MKRLRLKPGEAILDLKTGKIFLQREAIAARPWLMVVQCYETDEDVKVELVDEKKKPTIMVPVTSQGVVDYEGLAVFRCEHAQWPVICKTNELAAALAGTAKLKYKEFQGECFRQPWTEKAEEFCIPYKATIDTPQAEAEKLLAKTASGLWFRPEKTYLPESEFWEPLGIIPQSDGWIYKCTDGIARHRYKTSKFGLGHSWQLEDVLPPEASALSVNAYVIWTSKNHAIARMLAANGKQTASITMDARLLARVATGGAEGRSLLLRALRLRLLYERNKKKIRLMTNNPPPAADGVHVGIAEALAAGACYRGILKAKAGGMENATSVDGKTLQSMVRSFSLAEGEFALRALAIATLAAGKRH